MKTMIMSALIVVSVALLSAVSQANTQTTGKKVLLVSDIDDTIKVSNILSLTSKYVRAFNITTPFTGMSQLYQLIANEHEGNIQIAYLSNAPQEIQGVEVMRISHENFLSLNDFPKGDLLLRADIKDQNHKINSIRELVKTLKPELVIMVGDNGERDVEVYEQAAKEIKALGLESVTYIHQVYSSKNWFFEVGKKLAAGQIGFVTPFEIALDLNKKELLGQDSIDWMTQEVMPSILEEEFYDLDTLGSVAFPSFMNCSDFKWTTKVPTSLLPLASKINKRCR
jgi:hypothetical protein